MGILLVYDITNEQSFENIAEWLQNIDKHTTGKVRPLPAKETCNTHAFRQLPISVVGWLRPSVLWISIASAATSIPVAYGCGVPFRSAWVRLRFCRWTAC